MMWEPARNSPYAQYDCKAACEILHKCENDRCMVLDRSRYGQIIKLVGLANVQAMHIMFYVYDCKTAGFKQPLGTVQL